ncbi:MAG: cob(I)yrinic acid a,c-diamide adenosyltransferase [Candidatus Omnitrophota bacterium]|jgi:cob(I)alamin adenosyltransferase
MVHLYIGRGKGKTTAALGLAIRAAGAGLKVYIGQFIKSGYYNEIRVLKKIPNIKIEQYGRGCFIPEHKPSRRDVRLAATGLERARRILAKRKYNLVILDEINVALHLRLLKLQDVLRLVKQAQQDTELILTGRYAPLELIRIADLVSEIRDIKHYHKKGITARKGIEY